MVLDLRERRLDALLVDIRSVPADPDLTIEPLAKLRIGFLCRRKHPLRRLSQVRFDDLNQYPIACTSISEEVGRAMVAQFGPAAHPSLFVTLRSEDISGLLNVIAESDAIFLGALAATMEKVKQGELFSLPVNTEGFDLSVGLVRLAGRTDPLALAAVRQLVRDTIIDFEADKMLASRARRRRSAT